MCFWKSPSTGERLGYGSWKRSPSREAGRKSSSVTSAPPTTNWTWRYCSEKHRTLSRNSASQAAEAARTVDAGVSGLRTVGEYHYGAELVLGHLFDRFGINEVDISIALCRQLVIARILYPVSKHRTAQFLNRHFNASLDEDQIYRFLDNLTKVQESRTPDIVPSKFL